MPNQRQSRYTRPPVDERLPIRFEKRDLAILDLFGPKQRFEYLTAQGMALLLNRPLNALQHRLQKLFHHGYLERWYPPHEYGGGSAPCVYLLGKAGAETLGRHLQRRVKVKRLGQGYHPFLMHAVLVDLFRALILRAAADRGVGIPVEFRDREFADRFRVQSSIPTDTTKPAGTWFKVVPDWLFSFDGGMAPTGETLPRRNFYLELQRSNNAVKNPKRLRERHKSMRHRFLSYYHYYKGQRWHHWAEGKKRKYAALKEPKNMRVLFVTEGMCGQEFDNLVQTARDIDERKVGIRLFWFTRMEDLANDPVRQITKAIWQTPVAGDPRRSIFHTR